MPPKTDTKPSAQSPVVLSEMAYQRLARDVKKLFERAEQSVQGDRVAAYWEIGRRIAEEKLESRAGYHHAIFRELSRDTGLSIRALQESLVFRTAYTKPPKKAGLSWSHYRVLARLEPGLRAELEKKALKDNWGQRQLLRAAVLAGSLKESPELSRPKAAGYLYKASLIAVVDGDTLDLDIDLGFRVWSKQRVRLALLDSPEGGTRRGREARNFLTETLVGAASLVVKSEKADIYGRFIVHLFASKVAMSIEDCFERGTYVNALLIEKGFAERIG